MASKANWGIDYGYEGCLVARKDAFAIVIVSPYWTSKGWGIQVYNEADEEAMDYGETFAEIEGLEDEDAAKEVAERLFF